MSNNTAPGFGEVDLTQDPNDFASILTGNKTVEESPTSPGSAAEEPAKPAVPGQVPANGDPQDNVAKTTDEPSSAKKDNSADDDKKPSTEDIKVTDSQQQPKLSPEEHRIREAQRAISIREAENKRATLAMVELVKNDPAHLSVIAKYDQAMADRVTKEVYGYDSVEEYQEAVRIEQLKQEDPDRGQLEERLARLEKKERDEFRVLRQQIENKFFEEHGISQNQFDENNILLREKLKLLDPQFVANNITEALTVAYSLAFPSTPSVSKEEIDMQAALNQSHSDAAGGSGGITTPPAAPSPYSEEQNSFANLVGAALN